ncbi:IS1 family transposase [Candidatus Enterovibrio escicola]
MLSIFNVVFWCTNNFNMYDILPANKHLASKLYTQRIKR